MPEPLDAEPCVATLFAVSAQLAEQLEQADDVVRMRVGDDDCVEHQPSAPADRSALSQLHQPRSQRVLVDAGRPAVDQQRARS
jgi:hypothetical protein